MNRIWAVDDSCPMNVCSPLSTTNRITICELQKHCTSNRATNKPMSHFVISININLEANGSNG